MKKSNQISKLLLSKETIVKLNQTDLNALKGGIKQQTHQVIALRYMPTSPLICKHKSHLNAVN